MERIYHLFFEELLVENKKYDVKDQSVGVHLIHLEGCFRLYNHWTNIIEEDPVFMKIGDHWNKGRGIKLKELLPQASSIVFWRHTMAHYNSKVDKISERVSILFIFFLLIYLFSFSL